MTACANDPGRRRRPAGARDDRPRARRARLSDRRGGRTARPRWTRCAPASRRASSSSIMSCPAWTAPRSRARSRRLDPDLPIVFSTGHAALASRCAPRRARTCRCSTSRSRSTSSTSCCASALTERRRSARPSHDPPHSDPERARDGRSTIRSGSPAARPFASISLWCRWCQAKTAAAPRCGRQGSASARTLFSVGLPSRPRMTPISIWTARSPAGKMSRPPFGEQQIDFGGPAADALDRGQVGDRLLVVGGQARRNRAGRRAPPRRGSCA